MTAPVNLGCQQHRQRSGSLDFLDFPVGQLGAALEIRKRWLGWSVPQLIDRLRPVGVGVEVEKVLLPI